MNFDWVPYENNPVIDENFDPASEIIFRPSVIFDGVIYHMWYGKAEAGRVETMAYATSPDGINWTNVPGSRTDGAVLDWGASGAFDERTVAWPAVIKTDAGFEMWYDGVDNANNNRLGCATSPDGIAWTRVSGSGTKGACFDEANAVSVVKQESLYRIWYGVFDLDIVNLAFSGFIDAVYDLATNKPIDLVLKQNYPNPFNPETVIEYQLPRSSAVEISIFNLQGQKVATLVRGHQTAGAHKIIWNGTDESGRRVARGVYLYQLKAGDPSTSSPNKSGQAGQRFVAVRKMLVVR